MGLHVVPEIISSYLQAQRQINNVSKRSRLRRPTDGQMCHVGCKQGRAAKNGANRSINGRSAGCVLPKIHLFSILDFERPLLDCSGSESNTCYFQILFEISETNEKDFTLHIDREKNFMKGQVYQCIIESCSIVIRGPLLKLFVYQC